MYCIFYVFPSHLFLMATFHNDTVQVCIFVKPFLQPLSTLSQLNGHDSSIFLYYCDSHNLTMKDDTAGGSAIPDF